MQINSITTYKKTIFQPLTEFAKYLVACEFFTEKIAKELQEKARRDERSFVRVLIQANLLEARKLAQAISKYFGLPLACLIRFPLSNKAFELFEEHLITKYRVLPLAQTGKQLLLALADPTDVTIIDEIKFHTQMEVEPVIVEYTRLNDLIDEMIQIKRSQALEHIDFKRQGQKVADAPVVKFIDDIFCSAVEKNASDVHFEPYEKFYRIRLRVDGLLQEIARTDLILAQRFSARLKIMARLDIAERRLPQDGRFTLKLGEDLARDCRISTCPTLFGEKIVVRILNPSNVKFNIGELGLGASQQKMFLHYIQRCQGMILVAGPTGSGKTVSLYSALNVLNDSEKNISSVEDPVEINLPGVNQVEVNYKIGLGFAKVLRTFLRQDPDVIMVGEIRDLDTAQIAIKAAQTGHLVLATLHTNSASEAITRLLNMGIAAFNLMSSIDLIIAQRLVRKLCPYCKKQCLVSDETLHEIGFGLNRIDNLVIYSAQGCEKCDRGYRGRTGIFELLPFTAQFESILLEGVNALAIAERAKQEGMPNLRFMAIDKVMQGITSLEEISRVIA